MAKLTTENPGGFRPKSLAPASVLVRGQPGWLHAEHLSAGGNIYLGIPPDQLEEAVRVAMHKEGLADAERAKYAAEIERLSVEIQVRKPVVENFLRILGMRNVLAGAAAR